jgi:hypothetical protein
MKRIIFSIYMLFMIIGISLAQDSTSSSYKIGENSGRPPVSFSDPITQAYIAKKEIDFRKAVSQINQGKDLEQIEKVMLDFKNDPCWNVEPDRLQKELNLLNLNATQRDELLDHLNKKRKSHFGEFEYFALAQCQEKMGKKKQALESYRAMYSSHGAERTRERYMGLYALCALDSGYFNEARIVTQECIDAMRKHMAYGKEYEYITDVTATSDTNVIRAHVYLLLSRGIAHGDNACGWTDNGGPKTQEYLKKAIELGRKTTPNAYLKMAEYTRWSNPAESRKYLEEMAKQYKKYPIHAEEAKKRLKDYPPAETEKPAGK